MCAKNLQKKYHSCQQQTDLVDWINKHDWDIAATFDFEAYVTDIQAKKTFRHFWNIIDKKYYKNASKRYNKKCERVCFLERTVNSIHYHCIMKTPERTTDEAFIKLLQQYWHELEHTGKYGIIEKTSNNVGWIRYISKGVTAGNTDALDAETTHIDKRRSNLKSHMLLSRGCLSSS